MRRIKTNKIMVLLIVAFCGSAAWGQQPNDPFFASNGSWKQEYDDQWGLKQSGYRPLGSGESAWDIETGTGKPVVVAVIDTGLDFYHPDIRPENIWYNPDEIENGKDDDKNGYIDDVIGWDFIDNDNRPWDRSGHGTLTAGIIAAHSGNKQGIAGINRGARIMVLRALNFIGRGRSAPIAAAIYYAADKGARVINLSLGGRHLSRLEYQAVKYAHKKGAVVVAAAGNQGIDTTGYAPAAYDNLITVAATGPDGKRAAFSNWGKAVDIAAPGVEILSLRARFTDLLMTTDDKKYKPGQRFVGDKARYYRVTGTSFAAPIVAGTASLLIARDPRLTPDQVTRMLLHSARDIEIPGTDQYTGYGQLDAIAALKADPAFFVEARIENVSVVQKDGQPFVQVKGTADASEFAGAQLELGKGDDPDSWKEVGTINETVTNGLLGLIPAKEFQGAKKWLLRIVSEHKNGRKRENRFILNLG